ncbi:MAG TPA: pilus assembly protein TadG-related protein [Cryobacterium sp.]|nr:pilus assembly protein TadG-related protein [Cryobacterium sp.]
MRWIRARLGNERGASAVLVAVLLVPLLGFAAIALDVGALYVERGQLQNGADAAALAIAQDCADGDCGDFEATAEDFADGNANDGAANVLTPTFPTSTSVTVTSSTRVAGTDAGAISHPFARFIGVDETTVRAAATAEWGGPGSGPVLALALSWCEFQDSLGASGNHVTIRTDTNKECKRSPSEEIIPGGFGWLDNVTAPCEATINLSLNLDVNGELWAGSDAGGDVNNDCKARLESLKDTQLLVPIYDLTRGTGANAEYRIFAFAAFTITGWKFPSTSEIDPLAPLCPPVAPGDGGAGGKKTTCDKGKNWRGIQGYFSDWVSIDSAFGLGGPELNAPLVKLIK